MGRRLTRRIGPQPGATLRMIEVGRILLNRKLRCVPPSHTAIARRRGLLVTERCTIARRPGCGRQHIARSYVPADGCRCPRSRWGVFLMARYPSDPVFGGWRTRPGRPIVRTTFQLAADIIRPEAVPEGALLEEAVGVIVNWVHSGFPTLVSRMCVP
jgi:hypothetical protein